MGGLGCDNMTCVLVCFLHNQPYQTLVDRCAKITKAREIRENSCGETDEEQEEEMARMGPKRHYFQDPYVLPPIPELKLADPARVLEKAMERTKRIRSQFRVQFIPLEEMFTSQELMDLRAAFDAVSMGQDFVDRASLQSSFQNLGIIASEEMLAELLNAMGQIAN